MTSYPPPPVPVESTLSSSCTSPTSSSNNNKNDKKENEQYKCSIEIKFPSTACAQQALEVLSVDQEIGDRVVKTLFVRDDLLLVNVQSSEAKMLRVSISSFYDMLTVFLKCHQEFGS